MGRPGVDFPILPSIPHTDFSCKKVKKPGYYADPETDCQVNNIHFYKLYYYSILLFFKKISFNNLLYSKNIIILK